MAGILTSLLGRRNPNTEIEIYTWRTCPFCLRAKLLLRRKRLDYTEYRIDGDEAARERMAERANGQRTVPEIFIDGRHIGGCSELVALARSGELDRLAAR